LHSSVHLDITNVKEQDNGQNKTKRMKEVATGSTWNQRNMKDALFPTERDAVIECYCQYSRSTTGACEEKMVRSKFIEVEKTGH